MHKLVYECMRIKLAPIIESPLSMILHAQEASSDDEQLHACTCTCGCTYIILHIQVHVHVYVQRYIPVQTYIPVYCDDQVCGWVSMQ